MAALSLSEVATVGRAIKIVGFTFDCKLTWSGMVADKAKKARTRVAALRRMSGFLDSNNLKLMYTAFVRPVMEYGSLLYVSGVNPGPTVI